MTEKGLLQEGDILCKCRADNGGTCTINYNAPASEVYKAHCDVVVNIGPQIDVIGGNIGDAVTKTSAVNLNDPAYFGFISC